MATVSQQSKFVGHVKSEPWRETAIATFRSFATIREGIRRGSRLSSEESVAFCKGSVAGDFAGKLVSGLEAATKAAGCSDICELQPQVVSGLPGAYGEVGGNADVFVFGSTNSVVFGLVRPDGKVTPVVFNDRGAVLVQKGSGHFAMVYDEQTDLAGLLKDNLTQRSFV